MSSHVSSAGSSSAHTFKSESSSSTIQSLLSLLSQQLQSYLLPASFSQQILEQDLRSIWLQSYSQHLLQAQFVENNWDHLLNNIHQEYNVHSESSSSYTDIFESEYSDLTYHSESSQQSLLSLDLLLSDSPTPLGSDDLSLFDLAAHFFTEISDKDNFSISSSSQQDVDLSIQIETILNKAIDDMTESVSVDTSWTEISLSTVRILESPEDWIS